ncbi:MAG: hypothetical protein M1837_003704 [Sclerophora amabilis]|nr:MAG: hypothetical protein M1837_003704 [Sclerophora amabilis]
MSKSPPGLNATKMEANGYGATEKTSSDVEKGSTRDNPHDENAAPASPRSVHGISWVLVILGTLSSIFLYALDNTIVADVIPVIVNRLGHADQLPWLSVGFMIGGVSVVLPFGRIFGLFNVKWLYVISTFIFMVGSAVCGAAPTMDAMIVGRVIAGAGGNGMYLGVLTLISVNTSDKERPTGLIFGIGTVVGPVIGGAFAQSSATWRWAFYLNLVVGGIFAPVYLFLLPSFDPRAGQSYSERARQFDYLGAALSVGTLACIIMAISFGGTTYAWDSGPSIALFVVAGVLLIGFAVQQASTFLTKVPERMFPVQFLKIREAVLLFICAAASNTAGFVTIYYIPVYFQFTRGDAVLDSAIRLLPLIFMISSTILISGALMAKFGYYQPWYVGGNILALVGAILLSRMSITTPTANVYGFEILLGIGVGCTIQAGYAVIQVVVDFSEMSYGISFMMLAQLLGIAMGLAISGAVFVNRALAGLVTLLPDVPREEIQGALSGTSGDFFKTLPADTQALALDILMHSLQKVFILVYVAAAVGLLASGFLSRKKLVG